VRPGVHASRHTVPGEPHEQLVRHVVQRLVVRLPVVEQLLVEQFVVRQLVTRRLRRRGHRQ
jgi:hypothetical protein